MALSLTHMESCLRHPESTLTRQKVEETRWHLCNIRKDIWLSFLLALGEHLVRKTSAQIVEEEERQRGQGSWASGWLSQLSI